MIVYLKRIFIQGNKSAAAFEHDRNRCHILLTFAFAPVSLSEFFSRIFVEQLQLLRHPSLASPCCRNGEAGVDCSRRAAGIPGQQPSWTCWRRWKMLARTTMETSHVSS